MSPGSLRAVRHGRKLAARNTDTNAGLHPAGHDPGKGMMILPSKDGSARTAEGEKSHEADGADLPPACIPDSPGRRGQMDTAL